jgi:hypothetical protein
MLKEKKVFSGDVKGVFCSFIFTYIYFILEKKKEERKYDYSEQAKASLLIKFLSSSNSFYS